MASYRIPAEQCEAEIEVKRSQFLGFAAHTPGLEEAKNFIQTLKDRFPDARHHCYGFMAGAPWDSNQYGFSDDNEPSGTAGMPIFSHLKHNNIGEITIVIVRYFGGTKLGTGGLARAYSDATKATLEGLELQDFIEMETVEYEIEFSQEAQIRKIITDSGGETIDCHYSEKVTITATIPSGKVLPLPYSIKASRSTI